MDDFYCWCGHGPGRHRDGPDGLPLCDGCALDDDGDGLSDPGADPRHAFSRA